MYFAPAEINMANPTTKKTAKHRKLYANIMAPELKEYAEKLDPSKVGKVILFTTSNWSRRTVLALRKLLTSNGIRVNKDFFYAHMLHIEGRKEAAREFGRQAVSKI